MTEPLDETTLADIRAHVQRIREAYPDEGVSAGEVVLAMDTGMLLDAYDRLRAQLAAVRPIVEAVAAGPECPLHVSAHCPFPYCQYDSDSILYPRPHDADCPVALARAALERKTRG
jgi:hypothetical protein